MHNDDWFEKQQKSMFKSFGIIWTIGLIISVSVLIGVIYFIFWCLKHFGVIH